MLFGASGNALIERRELLDALHRFQLSIGTLADDRLILSKKEQKEIQEIYLSPISCEARFGEVL